MDAQNRLVFQASDLSLGTIFTMVEREAINVNPPYQRRERWSREKQSALIESFLLNVPVPPIYLAEDEFGQYSVVDGKQRITSIHSFIGGKLKLSHLESFSELEGLYFSDLPREIQNALEVRPYFRVITLLKQSDPNLKFEVFTRLNRGGESMEPQELRNVAFRGELNDLIYTLSQHQFLWKQLKIKDHQSASYQVMSDAELVLRFFTLRERWKYFSGDYRLEMDSFMQQNQRPSSDKLTELKSSFNESIFYCERIWGDFAFKRPAGDSWRDLLLAGMYDAQMVAIDQLTREEKNAAASRSKEIIEMTRLLFEKPEFDTAVRVGTNTPSRVIYRIEQILKIIR